VIYFIPLIFPIIFFLSFSLIHSLLINFFKFCVVFFIPAVLLKDSEESPSTLEVEVFSLLDFLFRTLSFQSSSTSGSTSYGEVSTAMSTTFSSLQSHHQRRYQLIWTPYRLPRQFIEEGLPLAQRKRLDKDRRVRNDWIGFTYNLDVRIPLWFRDSEYAL
jgi:hypothetical protein